MTTNSFERELLDHMTRALTDEELADTGTERLSMARDLTASALTTDKIHLPASSLSRVSPNTRKKAADDGTAMNDGSFPIRDGADLRRAVKAFGRAKDKEKTKRHIIRRARALKKTEVLPDSWRPLAAREFPGQASAASLAATPTDVTSVLSAKAERHNECAASDRQASVPKLRCVYNRGLESYKGQLGVTAEQFAQSRVNAFLRLLANGEPDSLTYTEDDDLLPSSHPVREPPFA